jgi:hypothetical protein
MMAKRLLTSLSMILLIAAAIQGKGKGPPHEILRISLGMTRADVHARLQKIGHLEKEERKRQEVWGLKQNAYFSHLLIGFDSDFKVRYLTAVARPNGRRMRYSDLADLKLAKQKRLLQNFQYEWQVPARGNLPAYVVMARGTDPRYLTTYSLKSVN